MSLRWAKSHVDPTYKGLDMEEEHPNGVVPGFVQLEEVYGGVLYEGLSRLVSRAPKLIAK